jgi:dolichol-phosphate mannosyltransferase
LPKDWVGRPWALHYGLGQATGAWVLGIDADTVPQPGLVNALIEAAEAGKYGALSLSPRFIMKTPGENWLHPALLMTLIFRFGPTGSRVDAAPDRVMANGQCFLARREVLLAHGGYSSARASFCDDVTLARHLATAGVRVGFLDGSQVFKVRMYTSGWETWQEWGRSLDLKDASTPQQQVGDVIFLLLTLGLPLPILLLLGFGNLPPSPLLTILGWVNGILFTLRLLLLGAIAPSFEGKTLFFWLSPLADPLAALRILLSSLRRPTRWRGRTYKI